MIYTEYVIKILVGREKPPFRSMERVYNFNGLIHSRFLPIPLPTALSSRAYGYYIRGLIGGPADNFSWEEDPD